MMLTVTIGSQRKAPQQGSLHTIDSFTSKYVDARRVDVWLPADYNPLDKYAVLYMHDGQNLFDPEFSFGGVTWAVDKNLQKLINQQKVRATIVVGIWNTPKRYWEYLPEPAYQLLPASLLKVLLGKQQARPLSDNYLKFITEELKPFVDANYPTLSDPENTIIMGSSMGGLISSYALGSYPDVFGGAGCLSTHWPLSGDVTNLSYSKPYIGWLKQRLPAPGQHRMYFDYGTEQLDANYEMHQHLMDEVMREKGYTPGDNWLTYKAKGDNHNELSWQKRLPIPLEFLLRD